MRNVLDRFRTALENASYAGHSGTDTERLQAVLRAVQVAVAALPTGLREPDPGWRLLELGETIPANSEYWHGGRRSKWIQVSSTAIGKPVLRGAVRRVPIHRVDNLPTGWRWLNPGDTIAAGDAYYGFEGVLKPLITPDTGRTLDSVDEGCDYACGHVRQTTGRQSGFVRALAA